MTNLICFQEKFADSKVRTSLTVLSILLWFVGCAILSIGGWLLFIDGASVSYYQNFTILKTALYILFICGITFLVISLLGTCGANMKSGILIFLSLTSLTLICIAEFVALFFFIQNQDRILAQLRIWFDEVFMNYEKNETSQKIVDHIQHTLRCCGVTSPADYSNNFAKQTAPPSSCHDGEIFADDVLVRPNQFQRGCLKVLVDHVSWLIDGWPIWITFAVVVAIQLPTIFCDVIYLVYLIRRIKYEDDSDDEFSSGLIDYNKQQLDSISVHAREETAKISHIVDDLPLPRIFRLERSSSEVDFGFEISLDENQSNFIISQVERNSVADMVGLTTEARVVEINGLMTSSATFDEIQYKLKMAGNELLILIIDRITLDVYEEYNVTINNRNVEGVTSEKAPGVPRLCVIDKGNTGFGFNLLYLEDRRGEFIEDVLNCSPAYKAGLKIGDRIVEVNGRNVDGEKSKKVVDRIRMSGHVVCLLVVDPKTDGFYRKKAVSVTASLATEFYAPRDQQYAPTDKRLKRREVKPRYCRLVKRTKEEFGLYIVIDNQRIGQVIRWVDCGGAADRAGLRIGDRIVEINGHNVEYENDQNLISVISICKNLSHFIVVDEDYDRAYKRNKPRLCRLFKQDEAFGFCIDYVTSNDGHYIIEVDPNGPAERAGLKIGDRIIQINGSSMEQKNKEEILKTLRCCKDEVILLVIDRKSSKHYKRITEFKNLGLKDVQYDSISIPDGPIFLPNDVSERDLDILRHSAVSIADSFSMTQDTRSHATIRSMTSLAGGLSNKLGAPRQCVLKKVSSDLGFFLAVDRDRDGQIIQRFMTS